MKNALPKSPCVSFEINYNPHLSKYIISHFEDFILVLYNETTPPVK